MLAYTDSTLGPPCQGFSGSNRFKKADDIKNSLVVMYLSFVDFYRPKYSLLENVRGLLTHRVSVEILEL
jgi:site-specific DNA-cytosine methylase